MRHPDILTRDGSVLLVCDVQKKCIKPIYKKESMIKNIKKMISFASLVGMPILLNELAPQKFGGTIEELKKMIPRIEPLKRNRFSCFGNEELSMKLETININTLVVVGMETHISVCQTVLDALSRGFRVHLILNATSSCKKINWKLAVDKMKSAGATITTADIVMHEIAGGVDAKEYTKISEIIKKEN